MYENLLRFILFYVLGFFFICQYAPHMYVVLEEVLRRHQIPGTGVSDGYVLFFTQFNGFPLSHTAVLISNSSLTATSSFLATSYEQPYLGALYNQTQVFAIIKYIHPSSRLISPWCKKFLIKNLTIPLTSKIKLNQTFNT